MNIDIDAWLPRSSAVNLLAGAFLLSALFAASQRRTAAAIRGLTWNSMSLALIAALMAATVGAHHLWLAALLVLGIKGVAIPRLLEQALARLKRSDVGAPYVSIPLSMLICGALVVLGFSVTRPVFGTAGTVLASCLPISVATMLVGLFLMVVRKHALMQIVGLVIVENAIFLAAISLTYGMPLVVEMGVLLDVLVAVALLGVFVGRIEQSFDAADTSRLTSLKEEP